MINFQPETFDTQINLYQSVQNLSADDKTKLDTACMLLHTIFPNLFNPFETNFKIDARRLKILI